MHLFQLGQRMERKTRAVLSMTYSMLLLLPSYPIESIVIFTLKRLKIFVTLKKSKHLLVSFFNIIILSNHIYTFLFKLKFEFMKIKLKTI